MKRYKYIMYRFEILTAAGTWREVFEAEVRTYALWTGRALCKLTNQKGKVRIVKCYYNWNGSVKTRVTWTRSAVPTRSRGTHPPWAVIFGASSVNRANPLLPNAMANALKRIHKRVNKP